MSQPPSPDLEHGPEVTSEKQQAPPFAPLAPSATKMTTASASARRAAADLEDFSKSAENPLNWPKSKRWGLTVIVSLSGFVSTFSSSIGVPGTAEVVDEFRIANEQLGILATTTGYVLGLG